MEENPHDPIPVKPENVLSNAQVKAETPAKTFPEGGFWGWAAIVGAFLAQFCGFGYTASFGVFQDHYVRIRLTNESASTISWIGSVNVFLVIAGGLVAGRVYDRGHFYALMWGGTLLTAFSLFMLSLTKQNEFYQVFLSQGVGAGLGIGMIYIPSMAVLSHYFQRRRSFAMTVITSGSSLGAIVHPIMLNNLFEDIGFEKASRANAGLMTGCLLLSCLLLRTRLPPPTTIPSLSKALVKFSKDKAYVCCSLGFFFVIIGLYFPLFYLQLDAIQHGLNTNFAFYALVILNGSSLVGRLGSGYLAGAIGAGTTVIIATAAGSFLIFSFIGLSSVASVVIIAVLYGFFSGIYIAIMGPVVASLADDFSEIGLRMGISFTSSGVGGLIGTPIAGALLTADYHWWRPAVFSGTMGLIGCLSYVGMFFFMRQRTRSKQMGAATRENP